MVSPSFETRKLPKLNAFVLLRQAANCRFHSLHLELPLELLSELAL